MTFICLKLIIAIVPLILQISENKLYSAQVQLVMAANGYTIFPGDNRPIESNNESQVSLLQEENVKDLDKMSKCNAKVRQESE